MPGTEISEAARVPIDGTFLESRLIGSTLCVVTQKTETIPVANGGVNYVPKTQVYAIDLADPAHPQVRGPLDVTNERRLVVMAHRGACHRASSSSWRRIHGRTASARAAASMPSISAHPEQPLSVAARFDLRGQLLSKFQLTYAGGILTTVSQAAGAVVETWDVAAALAGGASLPRALDSLLVGANESLFGTRFDGDRVYVVTFRRIDPLFCVDLGDPRDLRLLGELEVPGFSTYLEAFAEGSRLLSVGVEGGQVAVSLFDVADPAHPTMKAASVSAMRTTGRGAKPITTRRPSAFSEPKDCSSFPSSNGPSSMATAPACRSWMRRPMDCAPAASSTTASAPAAPASSTRRSSPSAAPNSSSSISPTATIPEDIAP